MRAFDAYYGARRTTLGMDWPVRRYAEHRSWKLFMKVAELCAKDGRDVERFVTTVVTHLPKNSNQVVPNDLTTKAAEAIWVAHKNDKKVDAAGRWAYFTRIVIQIQNTTGQSDETILATALNSQFPAWFRVMYPENLDDRIVETWGEEAVDDLRNDRDMVRFLRASMPGKMEAFEKKLGVLDGLQS